MNNKTRVRLAWRSPNLGPPTAICRTTQAWHAETPPWRKCLETIRVHCPGDERNANRDATHSTHVWWMKRLVGATGLVLTVLLPRRFQRYSIGSFCLFIFFDSLDIVFKLVWVISKLYMGRYDLNAVQLKVHINLCMSPIFNNQKYVI